MEILFLTIGLMFLAGFFYGLCAWCEWIEKRKRLKKKTDRPGAWIDNAHRKYAKTITTMERTASKQPRTRTASGIG